MSHGRHSPRLTLFLVYRLNLSVKQVIDSRGLAFSASEVVVFAKLQKA
jgi:hypothetical protein